MTSELKYKIENTTYNTTKMAQFGSDSFASKPFWHNGPAPGAVYNFPGTSTGSCSNESQRSQQPICTGSSVLGLKFENGVIICADNLASYGSMARFRGVPRVMKVNKNICVGVGGDYADYQYLQRIIDQKISDEVIANDGLALKPKALYTWLTRVMYNRRNKFDPLWNNYLVGGMQDGVPFLGAVDLRGMAYQDRHIATGYGGYIALPLLRDAAEKNPNMSQQQAEDIMKKCLEVLYYRDARSFPKYQMAIVTNDGVTVSDILELKSNWDLAHMISGY